MTTLDARAEADRWLDEANTGAEQRRRSQDVDLDAGIVSALKGMGAEVHEVAAGVFETVWPKGVCTEDAAYFGADHSLKKSVA